METGALPQTRNSGGTRSVFIADDSDDLRLLLRLLLQAEPGLELVGEAASGPAAVEAISRASTTPDILLLDVNMPMFDALDQLRRLREQHPGMHVVLYSGEDEDEGRRRIGDIGECSYVVKGRPDVLMAELRTSYGR